MAFEKIQMFNLIQNQYCYLHYFILNSIQWSVYFISLWYASSRKVKHTKWLSNYHDTWSYWIASLIIFLSIPPLLNSWFFQREFFFESLNRKLEWKCSQAPTRSINIALDFHKHPSSRVYLFFFWTGNKNSSTFAEQQNLNINSHISMHKISWLHHTFFYSAYNMDSMHIIFSIHVLLLHYTYYSSTRAVECFIRHSFSSCWLFPSPVALYINKYFISYIFPIHLLLENIALHIYLFFEPRKYL